MCSFQYALFAQGLRFFVVLSRHLQEESATAKLQLHRHQIKTVYDVPLLHFYMLP